MCENCIYLSLFGEVDGQEFYECANEKSTHFGNIIAYEYDSTCCDKDTNDM